MWGTKGKPEATVTHTDSLLPERSWALNATKPLTASHTADPTSGTEGQSISEPTQGLN